MKAVKSLEKCVQTKSLCEVCDETNGGSGHDPDLYLLNICELLTCSKYLFVCSMCYIVLYCPLKAVKYFCKLLYLCKIFELKCDELKCNVDMRLAVCQWAQHVTC